MKKAPASKTLRLTIETLRAIEARELTAVAGGSAKPPPTGKLAQCSDCCNRLLQM